MFANYLQLIYFLLEMCLLVRFMPWLNQWLGAHDLAKEF